MNSFAYAVKTQEARTTNGMKAFAGTGSANVDMFYKIGAARGTDQVPGMFLAALAENEDLALRILLWSRDVRQGAGERDTFRRLLKTLERKNPDLASRVMQKVPELGRWDDLFVFESQELKAQAYTLLGDALRAKNGLAAKWTPRKGPIAAEIRSFFGMTPKQYRKSLVGLTNVVEQQMCAKNWDEINFSHVPSVAASRYKKAFLKNAPESYKSYVEKLVKGDKTVKINATSVFPHDVLKDAFGSYQLKTLNPTILNAVTAQWDALPNYVGDSSVLAMVDTSGSMHTNIPGAAGLTVAQVAFTLGLYTADKNRGPFKDTFLTFNSVSKLMHLQGNIMDKLTQINKADWGGSTNVISGFEAILRVATQGNVADADMPKTLLILSDMQFNQCARFDDTAFQAVKRRFAEAGYTAPNVVFWNLLDSGTTPVKMDQSGAALVSGYSPSILTSVLSGGDSEFTPEGIMLKTIMADRYSLN